MEDSLQKGLQKKETKFWTPSEVLLLGADVHTASNTVNAILKSWSKVPLCAYMC